MKKRFHHSAAEAIPIEKGETLLIPVHDVLTILGYVWIKLQTQNPVAFPEADAGPIIAGFYEIMRHPQWTDGQSPPEAPVFPSSCMIHEYRPRVCRTFPLERIREITIGRNNERTTRTTQQDKVRLNKNTCPEEAFREGGKYTAETYLKIQQVQQLDIEIYTIIQVFFQKHKEQLTALSEEQLLAIRKKIFRLLYFTIDFIDDVESYYTLLRIMLTDYFKEIIVSLEEGYS